MRSRKQEAEEAPRKPTYYRADKDAFKQIAEANLANGLVLVTEERPNGPTGHSNPTQGLCFHYHKKEHCYPTGRKIRLRGVVLDEYVVRSRY